jgi:TolA-binding protein
LKKTNPKALKKLALAFAIVASALVIYTSYLYPNTLEARQKAELESTRTELIESQKTLQETETKNQQEDAKQQKQLQEIQLKLKETEKALQAKRESQAVYAEAQAPPETPQGTHTPPSGDWVANCHAWASQVGIALDSWAIELIDRESNCDPNIWNTAGSGACGIAQALPCSKLPNGINTPPQDQVRWMHGYVMGRYGSWQAAVEFHNANNWY